MMTYDSQNQKEKKSFLTSVTEREMSGGEGNCEYERERAVTCKEVGGVQDMSSIQSAQVEGACCASAHFPSPLYSASVSTL